MCEQFCVYIMSNKVNGTLYAGSTCNPVERIWQHREGVVKGSFSEQYGLKKLVYYELHDIYEEAARREKRIKKWPRRWKLNLINSLNPTWDDLYDEICE